MMYVNDNGRVTCLKHGGYYLQSAVEANPAAEIHFTPLGSISAFGELDSARFGLKCEDCK